MKKGKAVMRNIINISPELKEFYAKKFIREQSNSICRLLFKTSDLNTTFVHDDREYKIIGMNSNYHVILEETVKETVEWYKETLHAGVYYWETNPNFVMMKLGYNFYTYKRINGELYFLKKGWEKPDLLFNISLTKKRVDPSVKPYVFDSSDATEILSDDEK